MQDNNLKKRLLFAMIAVISGILVISVRSISRTKSEIEIQNILNVLNDHDFGREMAFEMVDSRTKNRDTVAQFDKIDEAIDFLTTDGQISVTGAYQFNIRVGTYNIAASVQDTWTTKIGFNL